MRLVGSMTTLPDRTQSFTKTIWSIIRQSYPLDVLYLNIPLKTMKGKTYNIQSDFLKQFEGFHTKVVINQCVKDYGPITKLAPALSLENDPDTYIITFDDDIIPRRRLVETLRKKIIEHPGKCLGFSGGCKGHFPFFFQLIFDNTKDTYVDWIQGVHVVAYKRSFFTGLEDLVSFGDDTPLKEKLVFNDDHRISGYLASKNIPRMSIGHNIKDFLYKQKETQTDALSKRHVSLIQEHYNIIKYFSEIGLYHLNSCVYRSVFFLSIIIFGSGIIPFFLTRGHPLYIRFFLSLVIIIITGCCIRNKLALEVESSIT